MSKYNLIDILEQYQIGSGWTNDFDYDGMLQAGLKTGVDTDIETLKKIVEDFTDVNYHREASHLYDAIEALEKGDAFEAEGRLSDFHAEIKKTMEDQGMDASDDLGAFMASKMDLDEGDAVDLAIEASQKKAGIKEDKYDDIVNADDDIPADKKKEAALAYRKVDKGASYKKSTSHIKEEKLEEMTGEIYSRIDGMIDQNLKAEFIDKFISIQEDFIESGEEFDALDVIDYLASEMQKYTVKSFMEEKTTEEAQRPGYNADGTPKSNAEMSDDEREDFYMNLDSVDEDKALKEHFNRFMKDYQ